MDGATDGMKVRKMKRAEEKRSRVLTSLFIRIYQRVKKVQGEEEKEGRGKESELLKSRKTCGDS